MLLFGYVCKHFISKEHIAILMGVYPPHSGTNNIRNLKLLYISRNPGFMSACMCIKSDFLSKQRKLLQYQFDLFYLQSILLR